MTTPPQLPSPITPKHTNRPPIPKALPDATPQPPALRLHTPRPNPPPETGCITVTVHTLTAKISLNRPEEDLLPSHYLKKADRSPIVSKAAWTFRDNTEDARRVDLDNWSKVDIRYRGVFRTLAKVPKFNKGLYEDVAEGLTASSIDDAARFQDQVVYALLSEVLDVIDLRRWVLDGEDDGYFYLRLLNMKMEYLTGYRERHKDAPTTAGFVSLDFHELEGYSRMILPVSTTKAAQPLEQALTGKFKQILAQLAQHIHHLRPPGDKFPDQEVFLVGLHGSRLHILRAFFPGRKTSYLWCGRTDPATPDTPASPPAVTSPRFYSKENIERLLGEVMARASGTGTAGDSDPGNIRTFRVLGTREYDLWLAADFRDAVRVLAALGMYLMSGKAQCGFLQRTFEQYSFDEGSEEEELERELEQSRQKAAREQAEVRDQEKRLEKDERKEKARARERFFDREARRSTVGDRIGGFGDVRREGWNWVWEDKKMDPPREEEDDEDVILNNLCMSGRPD